MQNLLPIHLRLPFFSTKLKQDTVQVDSDDECRKRKRIYRPYADFFSVRILSVCLAFFVILLISDWLPFRSRSIHPAVKVSSSISHSGVPLQVEDRVVLPDNLLLILYNRIHQTERIDCVYYKMFSTHDDTLQQVTLRSAVSVDDYRDNNSIVRCHLHPQEFSPTLHIDLQRPGDSLLGVNKTAAVPTWEKLVYEAVLDWNTAVVFVKGLNLTKNRESDPTQFTCHFSSSNFDDNENKQFVLTSEATAAAQEVIRCVLPPSIRNNIEKARGIGVTVSVSGSPEAIEDAADVPMPLPSVAKIYSLKPFRRQNKEKYDLCACTMLWNQASFLREWIIYHAWLGVERWFIYDNNSEDALQEVIDELNMENYNVTRHAWPWIKSQEAGFSHCALRAKYECKWLGFFDVDEFFFFRGKGKKKPGPNPLRALVANYTDSPRYAELRTLSRTFGPSGLAITPQHGVTIGYTCRLKAPERYKSIIRPELLHISLLNAVYHFRLREGYTFLKLPKATVVMNHYKYQVWDNFKDKYIRRVSTYIPDWKTDLSKKSKDRPSGLGTKPIQPSNWRLRFCEDWDYGLRNFVMENFADNTTGFLPWERSLL